MSVRWRILVIGGLLISIFAVMPERGYCEGRMKYTRIEDIPESCWVELSNKRIYFGHQSVGFDILGGIKELKRKYKYININIVEGDSVALFKKPVLVHSKIGKNTKPEVKFSDFKKVIDNGVGRQADVIFLKLCFVDIRMQSDVHRIFNEYSLMVNDISNNYPSVEIVHFTVPLMVSKENWKTKIKSILGKEAWEYADNIKRSVFNELMRDKYKEIGVLFDIAKFESTRVSGERVSFSYKGEQIEMLNPEYSLDGGHLNSLGAQKIAEELLLFLVNL